jgi:hypothetical protein
MQAFSKLADWLLPRQPREVARPEQELRFTRSRQAMTFLAAGMVIFCLACLVFFTGVPVSGIAADQAYHRSLWALPIMVPALSCFWAVVHCTRHAYIILTPLGVELFPFWRPSRNMQVIYWPEIRSAGVSGDLRTLTIKLKSGQIMATLVPITRRARMLLKQAVEGRMAKM